MKFGATLAAAAESARLHAHADHLVPYDELKAALRQPALPGPAEYLGELKLHMDDLNAHVGGCVEALEAIVAGSPTPTPSFPQRSPSSARGSHSVLDARERARDGG